MKIIVKTKPNSKNESVERITQPTLELSNSKIELIEYKVSVKEPPIGGRANNAVVKALAKYFDVAPSLICLVSGASSKRKVFQIPD
jgi:uncharacterized protein YggU (UPF0235/DUF167 family)